MATPLTQAFVLIGTQGSGKSATGNSIVGTACFRSMTGTIPLTTEIEEKTWQWQERDITIIDTPHINDQHKLTMITNQVRAKYTNIEFGFVIAIGRPLPIEPLLLQMIFENLDKKTEDLVLIFTRYDDLDSDKAFEIWLSNCPTLKAFIERTNIKCFHFANKNGIKPIKDQVNDLMSTITGITNAVKYNGSQKQGNRSIKVDTWVNQNKYNESQAHEKHSSKVKNTKRVKHAERLAGVESKPKILVSCQLLEEHFGKFGVIFYNEVLKNGTL